MTAFLLLFSALFLLLAFVLASSLITFAITRVPYVPSQKGDVQKFLNHFPLKTTDVVYDLGSGNGRVVLEFVIHSPVRAIGFELGLWQYLISKLWGRRNHHARFVHGNFFHHSWHKASVVYCYLFPPLMPAVAERFRQDCSSGTLLVSRDFQAPALNLIATIPLRGNHRYYVYKR